MAADRRPPLREIRLEKFINLSQQDSSCSSDSTPSRKRKRSATETGSPSSRKLQNLDLTSLEELVGAYIPPKSKGRISKTWTKTLRKKFTRRSIRQAEKQSTRTRTIDYSLPFGNTFDYFRFMDVSRQYDEDHELHKKIDHEMKMRDGSMKLLAASKHNSQQLEAAKTLHTSNCRMVAYMEDLQKRKTDITSPSSRFVEGNQVPCTAQVAVSEIRLPLMWKDSDHFKNKGSLGLISIGNMTESKGVDQGKYFITAVTDHKRFTVFCLVRIGTELYDTSLVSEVDRLSTDISFDDVIILNNIPHNFECRLEVYAYEHCEDMTIASSTVKLKKRISDISNTVGRRLSGLTVKEPFDAHSLPGPKFDLVAHTVLKLSDSSPTTSSFDLTVNKELDAAHMLPLFGSFCCRLAVQPRCLAKETVSGFLYVKEDTEWKKYWCSLQNLKISCWHSQFEADLKDPLAMIPVTKESIISDTDPMRAERPFSFHIRSRALNDQTWQLAAGDSHNLGLWWEGLQQHLLDQVIWKQSCETFMEITKPKTQTSPYFQRNQRAGSLYDRTRTKEKGVKSVLVSYQEGSPLTLAFNRLTSDSTDKGISLSRNNSYPK